MNFFEKYLTVWVLLCIVIGVLLGYLYPSVFDSISSFEIAHVNLIIALLIWAMIIPMMIKIDFRSLVSVFDYKKGIIITLFINWFLKPFSMFILSVVFLKYLFSPLLPAKEIPQYIAGLILLAAAPCTAMVFVWSRLTNGNPEFTLSQVALNDFLMLFLFAPIVHLLLDVSEIHIPINTIILSVFLYIIIPLVIGQILRYFFVKNPLYIKFTSILNTSSMVSLLLTLILLFALQGSIILKQPIIILLISVPIVIQVFLISLTAYYLNYLTKEKYNIAGPSALIGASNFFELAVAVAISLFGLNSGAALATVVGVLIEVPLMLVLVKIIKKTEYWYNLRQS